ncbi:HTH-type transcriptional regulator CysB [Haliea sp. AH-315-K21]|uniref:HTH-type transcriptional regulator CysB n=1 Tax=SAR86 cluster bacterium TaxID=2030880 RepID=A0A2A5CEF9_9GAMM|nr:HTH-type transcriptional regulator CysB [Haliea sp. AH-315-K21]PCJ42249.1 MAG: HTH-type transcriptional regulator CysB [SAR86 cluster bacterium]
MKLQQLRYIWEVAQNQLNISHTADKLFTSQPGISKQIRLLEEELGVQIFSRNGKQLQQVTPAGEKILIETAEILNKVKTIGRIADEYKDEEQGSLSIATTHTQSRYVLPKIIQAFTQRYPRVSLHLHQGTPMQISQMAADGTVDFAIATEALELFEGLIMMPCFHWNRSILVPKGHPLIAEKTLSLQAINQYPLITYLFGFTGRSKLDAAFEQQGLTPNVVVTAADADVIKTYVRAGLGVGIIAAMAWEPERDADLIALDASHLFAYSTTSIGFRRESFLRKYMLDFIEMFAPHLNRVHIQQAVACKSSGKKEALFKEEVPIFSAANS